MSTARDTDSAAATAAIWVVLRLSHVPLRLFIARFATKLLVIIYAPYFTTFTSFIPLYFYAQPF